MSSSVLYMRFLSLNLHNVLINFPTYLKTIKINLDFEIKNLNLIFLDFSFRSISPSRRRRAATSLPTYRALTGSGLSFVRVNGSTGDIVLKKELNFNSSPQLSISVIFYLAYIKQTFRIGLRKSKDYLIHVFS